MGRHKIKRNKNKKAAVFSDEFTGISSNSSEKTIAEADAAAGTLVTTSKATKKAGNVEGDKAESPRKSPNVNSKRARDILNQTKADGDDNNNNNNEEAAEAKLTRKQKRQKLNEKNRWPQHPKITSPEARERAYLRVAGIEKRNDDEDDVVDEEAAEIEIKVDDDGSDNEWRRFGRFLGSADARTRHKAVKRLGHYLKVKAGHGAADPSDVVGLSELDLLKLWKGLWFTLYMADKVPVQDELAKHIAKLMWCLVGPPVEDDMAGQAYLDMEMEEQLAVEQAKLEDEEEDDGDDGEDEGGSDDEEASNDPKEQHAIDDDDDEEEDDDDEEEEHEEIEDDFDQENHKHIRGAPLAQLMIRTFFRTLVREWGKMDKYRVDKFYTLARYTLHEVYKYMAMRQWNLGIIKLFNDAIAEEALIKQPNGVRYHLIDIALEELVAVVKSKKKNSFLPLTEAIFLEVMEPFFAMAQHGFGDRTVQARVVEKVLEKFLNEYSLVSDNAANGNSDKILDQVHVGTVSNFIFEMASDEGTLDTCRKSLYDVHKAYERQRKKMGTDLKLKFENETGEGVVGGDDDEAMTEDADCSEDDLNPLRFADDEKEEDRDLNSSLTRDEGKRAKRNKKKEKNGKQKNVADETTRGDGNALLASEVETKKGKQKPKDRMDTTQHNRDDKHKKQLTQEKKKKHEVEVCDKDEETLTISLSDQRKAKQAFKKHASKNNDEDNKKGMKEREKDSRKSDKSTGEGKEVKKKKLKRRVSFDNQNQARSWKASMKGLQTFDPSETASKTPEKSILLNKGKISPINKNAHKRRKRAVDYF